MDAYNNKLEEYKSLTDPTHPLLSKPRSIEDTGIPLRILDALLLKHLTKYADSDALQLSKRMALPGNIIELLLQQLKDNAYVEIRSDSRFSSGLRYGLTDKGRAIATLELQRDGYMGPVPISLDHYNEIVLAQSSLKHIVTPEILRNGLEGLILPDGIVNQVGPALNSGRAIFIYGLPGTGKTFISRRLVKLFDNAVYIPYAICAGAQVIQVYDPVIHKSIPASNTPSIFLDSGTDERLVQCYRPEVVVGGELTAEMLEITLDSTTRINRASLQLKANNGLLLIDDLGRQKMSVDAILNRWIIPLEERVDYLNTASGEHFEIPFEQILVFSSNIHPAQLADDAFLRRIGYKIQFGSISANDYQDLWHKECNKHQLNTPESTLSYIINQLHAYDKVPLLPCYPRDLVSMCANQIKFTQSSAIINTELIDLVWNCYFVNDTSQGGDHV
ncbi:AAA family ATPase [Photobacterium sp. BZF1]|uniref:AAA family ATPase n=1 Tax=Photobacterium sp. BZF1 TaxID=1904457 RepID=UPI0016535367|nr:AAA family ATPase [Photobacterium sp. BZF1]MBC7002830.1 AAA family ATPase [Photobacterium sp. BZF1]